MRILLIDPPFHRLMGFRRFYFPLGLAYLAAVLKRAGHHVRIYDAELGSELVSPTWINAAHNYELYRRALARSDHAAWVECAKTIERFSPDLIGISALSVKTPSAIRIARIAKATAPHVPIVVGADHPTAFPVLPLHRRH